MTKEIQLSQGKIALVDDEDFEQLSKHFWACRKGYASRITLKKETKDGKRHIVLMHREILGIELKNRKLQVDHINRNKLDNRRCNLRLCNQTQNQVNREKQRNNKTGYKGVQFDHNKFRAQIHSTYLGRFDTADEAAHVYDDAARKCYGEFVFTNFNDCD